MTIEKDRSKVAYEELKERYENLLAENCTQQANELRNEKKLHEMKLTRDQLEAELKEANQERDVMKEQISKKQSKVVIRMSKELEAVAKNLDTVTVYMHYPGYATDSYIREQ